MAIEVRVAGRGVVRGDEAIESADTSGLCSLCGHESDVVAAITNESGGAAACKGCLRDRLEAMTLASWRLRDGPARLPWGEITS